jgi:hypothetical protein
MYSVMTPFARCRFNMAMSFSGNMAELLSSAPLEVAASMLWQDLMV